VEGTFWNQGGYNLWEWAIASHGRVLIPLDADTMAVLFPFADNDQIFLSGR